MIRELELLGVHLGIFTGVKQVVPCRTGREALVSVGFY